MKLKFKFQDIDNFFLRLSKREKLLVSGAFLVVLAFWPYILFYQPAWENNASLKKQVKEKEAELKKVQQISTFIKIKAGITEEREFFKDFSALLAFFGREARKQNMVITSFNPVSPPASPGRQPVQTPAPSEGSEFSGGPETTKVVRAEGQASPGTGEGKSLVEIKTTGTYESIFNFFKEISKTKYLIGFQTLEIKKEGTTYPVLSADMVVLADYEKK